MHFEIEYGKAGREEMSFIHLFLLLKNYNKIGVRASQICCLCAKQAWLQQQQQTTKRK